jgi:eukaryotic-like serine/threonine-protein kinase
VADDFPRLPVPVNNAVTHLEKLQTALADRYSIEREIGVGGMATVYLAHDLRHDRDVALKLLKPELGAVLGPERFLSEIRVTAKLQHPNLLPLFDSGESDGQLWYVMPYVEGESLRARLDREKQLPIEEAVKIAVAVASALSYAHEHGIIHRDLKPENILIQSGQPVIADFGIALAVSNAGGARVTQTGLSLGTPQYMSPEQATGDREIDARSDIYSLGAVTYEMLAGEPPHSGTSAQAIIAKLMTSEPRPLHLIRSTVPVNVACAVEKALAKLPADRFASAHDFANAITNPSFTLSIRGASRRSSSVARWAPWLVAAALTVALGIVLTNRPKATEPLRMTTILPPPGMRFASFGNFAVSRDGARLVFAALAGAAERSRLWVRSFDTLNATPLAGTEGAQYPFWSPDGKKIGFFTDGQLKTIDATGGTARTLCAAPDGRGGTWSAAGAIVFTPALWERLKRVSADGADCRQALNDSAPTAQGRPFFLGDGRRFLFSVQGWKAIYVGDLATGEARLLIEPGGNAVSVAGYVLYVDGGPLYAQSFDERTLRLGERRIVSREIGGGGGVSPYSASSTVLVTREGLSELGRVIWLDSHSTPVDSVVTGRHEWTVAESHDRQKLAFGGWGITVFDLVRGVSRKLPVESQTATVEGTTSAVWAPSDSALVYEAGGAASNVTLHLRLYSMKTGKSEKLMDVGNRSVEPDSWSPDGRLLVFTWGSGGNVGRSELGVFSFADRQARRLFDTPFAAQRGAVSPDGRWLAYESSEGGDWDVYVRPFPAGAASLRVSTAGGREPTWNGASTLLYLSLDGRVMSANLALGSTLAVTATKALTASLLIARSAKGIELSSDGQKIGLFVQGEINPILTLSTNWTAKLAK